MKQSLAVMFEDVRLERSLITLLSLTDPDIVKQAKFTDHEINVLKKLALEELHTQRILKEEVAIAAHEVESE